jgi:hypothetical protein
MTYWVIAGLAWLLSGVAAASIAQAKHRSVGGAFAAGLFLGVIGLAIVACQEPTAVENPDGTWTKGGRFDWLIGSGQGAVVPAILLSAGAVALTAWFVVQASAGSYNTLDQATVEDSIAKDLKNKGVAGPVVSCPTSMSGKPGTVILCRVTSDVDSGLARVTVENSAGDITWVIIAG